jgi:Holliday junction resolvasome RuvABC endonuclease subunit
MSQKPKNASVESFAFNIKIPALSTEHKAVAGLDLSLRQAGVAILSKGQVFCYSIGYSLKKTSTEHDRTVRVVRIANQIMGLLKKHEVQFVGIENYAFSKSRSGSITMLADLGGTVKTQVYCGLKTCPIMLPVTTIRKFLLGKSTKEKSHIFDFFKRSGFEQPKNFDESDALAVAFIVHFWSNERNKIVDTERMRVLDSIDLNNTISED